MRFVIPEVVVSQFYLREGDVVADFGAGSGYFCKVLSAAVGPSGRVYACDIQKVLVEKLGAQAIAQGLENVATVWCDLEAVDGTKLQTGELDAAIVVNTLFQIEDKPTFLTEASRTLRSGGKLLIVDWTDAASVIGPQADVVIAANDCTALVESHGFVLERDFEAGEHHYGLAFRKV